MHRFFLDVDNIKQDKNIAIITGNDVHHINRVLRLKIGDVVSLTDGIGYDYLGKIVDTSDEEVIIEILDRTKSLGESEIYLRIYQGLPKSDKLELIIQKSTELGVKEIIPVQTARSVSKIDKGKKMDKKIDRWQKIAEAAAKQSKRGIVPKVDRVIYFKEAIKELENMSKDNHLMVVLYEDEDKKSFKDILRNFTGKEVSIFIGPEGGFEPEEIEDLKNNGFTSVSLGNRILRTESVSLVASSIIMYELGDLGQV